MARKAGQLVSRGPRTWLVCVSLGREPETGTRKYHRSAGKPKRGNHLPTELIGRPGQSWPTDLMLQQDGLLKDEGVGVQVAR
jgi:hypothetical protein